MMIKYKHFLMHQHSCDLIHDTAAEIREDDILMLFLRKLVQHFKIELLDDAQRVDSMILHKRLDHE